MAVDREHVNVTKKHSVAFALVLRDLKVIACFFIVIVHPGQLMVKIYSSIKYLCFQKVINAKQTPQPKK